MGLGCHDFIQSTQRGSCLCQSKSPPREMPAPSGAHVVEAVGQLGAHVVEVGEAAIHHVGLVAVPLE